MPWPLRALNALEEDWFPTPTAGRSQPPGLPVLGI